MHSDIGSLNPLPLTHAESRLHEQFAQICQAAGQRAPSPGLKISPPLAAWEAQYFLVGLEENLFALNQEGRVQSDLLARPENGHAQGYSIFSPERPPRLLRENVCQLAVISFLIFERGWLRNQVLLEPSRPEHRSTPHGVDLLVRSHSDRADIWVEARRTAAELQKLVTDLRACSRRGPHALGDCGFPQNHPRYEFCLFSAPAYLWAVAPDGEGCFKLNYEDSAIELQQVSSLPPRSLIEMS